MASAFDNTQLEQSHPVGKESATYRQPMLFVAGRAIDLVQGPMGNGSYKDTCNNWYTNYPKPNGCG
jgi:hypothetical protein